MDKKAKKKIDVLRKRVSHLEQQLAGATKQMDDPEEVTRLQQELDSARAQIEKWKAGE